jgi:pimeloyl-ACP methyl ester carboxylesterase
MRNEMDASPPIIHPIRGMNDSILLTQELLRRVRVPVSFLWGADDPFGSAAVATRFAAEIPGAELEVVPDGGHAVWIDEPDWVAARTKRFLAATPNG